MAAGDAVSGRERWGGPPPSYYEPPDDRHCPDCGECEQGYRNRCDARLLHKLDCPACVTMPCAEAPEIPEPCDPADHRLCAPHYAESRAEAAERKWDEERGK